MKTNTQNLSLQPIVWFILLFLLYSCSSFREPNTDVENNSNDGIDGYDKLMPDKDALFHLKNTEMTIGKFGKRPTPHNYR